MDGRWDGGWQERTNGGRDDETEGGAEEEGDGRTEEEKEGQYRGGRDADRVICRVLPKMLVFQHVFLQHIVQSRVCSSSDTTKGNETGLVSCDKNQHTTPIISDTSYKA